MAKTKGKQDLKDLTKKLESITAADIMTENPITAKENQQLSDVADLVIKKRISGLPVVDNKGKLIGVITITDLFMVMDMISSGDVMEDGKIAVSNPTVKFAMSTEVVSVSKGATVSEIIALMKYRNIHTLPIVEKGTLVGVIGRRDIYKIFYGAIKDLGL